MIRKYIIVAEDSIKGFDNEIARLEREWGAEEIEPCEDCISREEAIENFANWYGYDYDKQGYYRLLKQMLSVTPKFTDEEIQKMQELEQAQLDKAYELGTQTSFEEWLSSFNIDSATECFTAVQELKRRLEGENG